MALPEPPPPSISFIAPCALAPRSPRNCARSMNDDAMTPGWTCATCTPSAATSSASDWLKPSSANLVAVYADMPFSGILPPKLLTLTMAPRVSRSAGRKARHERTADMRFTWYCASQSSSVVLSNSPLRHTPAQFTSTSTLSYRSPTAATKASTDSAHAMSVGCASTRRSAAEPPGPSWGRSAPWTSRAVAASVSGVRAHSATL
mmetsp:Transcript_13795/g.57655  ORF Transcript_13795/g.57655 Transcript_13795/m.57655 type:complete len:204 (+) Transcript_13795:189-800(+)